MHLKITMQEANDIVTNANAEKAALKAKLLVELHGEKIRAVSQVGIGTEITIEL